MKRRNFLKMSAAGLGSASGFAMNLASFNAFASNTSGYRALVCVFLGGGSDGHDIIVPSDDVSNLKFRDERSFLYNRSRHDDNLIPLQGSGTDASNGSLADGREFGLPPELEGISNLYHNRNAAVIGNVGPLIEPTTRASFLNRTASLPPRLFSHNDQTSVWMASSPEGAMAGWGGRFGDIMQAANANANANFTLVSTTGESIFTTGENLNGFALTSSGASALNLTSGSAVREGYRDILFGLGTEYDNLFRRDLENKTSNALANGELMREIFSTTPDTVTTFPNSTLGEQLSSVAKTIANRDRLGMQRQIFFVQPEAQYDTHASQNANLPSHLRELDNAITAFYNETVELGVADEVTTFTASEFGRTLTPNRSGTDHGWGNHHFVIGGAVNGGQILGNIPEAETGHNQDAGRGRLIPEVSVDQYAFALARWFGLTESQARDVLPNSGNFDFRELYSIFNELS